MELIYEECDYIEKHKSIIRIYYTYIERHD